MSIENFEKGFYKSNDKLTFIYSGIRTGKIKRKEFDEVIEILNNYNQEQRKLDNY